MQTRYITTPTGEDEQNQKFHHLMPRFRHKHREPSGLKGKKTPRLIKA